LKEAIKDGVTKKATPHTSGVCLFPQFSPNFASIYNSQQSSRPPIQFEKLVSYFQIKADVVNNSFHDSFVCGPPANFFR
jgi:hypothetical protein